MHGSTALTPTSTGYDLEFLPRSDALKVLYNHVKDKSRLHHNKTLVSVEHSESIVAVKCEDGSLYKGDILIGADGVNSVVREELWRLAASEVPDLVERDRNGNNYQSTLIIRSADC